MNHNQRLGHLLIAALVAACSSNPSSPALEPDAGIQEESPDASPPEPVEILAHLPEGQHASYIVGFESYSPELQTTIDLAFEEAKEAGMQVARVQMDWKDVDSGGILDEAVLREQIQAYKQDGLVSFVSLYAIDSEGLVIPDDLADPESPTGIVGGVQMNDPMIVDRYIAMLTWAAPIIVEEGGYVLSIANEPESYMLETAGAVPAVINFYQQALDYLRSTDLGLAGTVTFASDVLKTTPPVFHADVMEVVDVATYNFYCRHKRDQDDASESFDEWIAASLDRFIERSSGRQILFQELGCPAGKVEGSLIGNTPAYQEAFLNGFYNALVSRPKIRASYLFQLVDWSPELASYYDDLLTAEGIPRSFIDETLESLTTVGVMDFDGNVRPAWQRVLQAMTDN